MSLQNREGWLLAAVESLRADFAAVDAPIPPKVHVSVGFPSRAALARSKKRIGECWSASASADGAPHVLISPVLSDPIEILGVLVHELVHAAVGNKCGHKGPFRRVAKALGLEGKMTATVVGEALKVRLDLILDQLGQLPHAALSASSGRKKQANRMLKLVCESCGFIARAARQPLDDLGAPEHCGVAMQEAVPA